MKKSIIAAGAASVALAAMPIVGAFAANTYDNITATVDNGCSIIDAEPSKTVALTVAPGNTVESTAAGSISVVCNGVSYHISAKGSTAVPSGYADGTATDLIATHAGDTPTYDRIGTGTTTGSSTASWAFMVSSLTTAVSGTGAPAIESGYNDWAEIPSAATPIVSGTASAQVTVNTKYQVYVPISQAAGAYQGQVTYTVDNQE